MQVKLLNITSKKRLQNNYYLNVFKLLVVLEVANHRFYPHSLAKCTNSTRER